MDVCCDMIDSTSIALCTVQKEQVIVAKLNSRGLNAIFMVFSQEEFKKINVEIAREA